MKTVLIDADPGTDDALAIMMALNSPELDVRAITTVGGNATLADTTRNALRLLEYLGVPIARDQRGPGMPVSRGASRPLRGTYFYGYYYHGAAGLGVRLPSPAARPVAVRAPELMVELASECPGQLTVVALGPLTNIARALGLEPKLARWVAEIVVMGGAVEVPGNVTPHAEFNIYNDSLAANIVFGSGIPIRLIGLDVTTQTYFGRDERSWASGGSSTARLSRRVLGNWFRSRPEAGRYALHDPLAVVAAARPGLFAYRRARLDVETEDAAQLGLTVASYGAGPVEVAIAVDVQGAMATVVELLSGPV